MTDPNDTTAPAPARDAAAPASARDAVPPTSAHDATAPASAHDATAPTTGDDLLPDAPTPVTAADPLPEVTTPSTGADVEPGPRPPGRIRHAWWAALDWWYATRWQVRSLGPTTADDYRDGTGQPVVVLPGVYETWHFMRPIMDALHDRGHPIHVVTTLQHNLRPVPASAELVMRVLEERDLHGVLLVAHSKGGLIGKYAMADLDHEGRIDRMVAVATPFGGTPLARFAPVPHLRAFRAADPVMAALGRELAVNARITSVYGWFDTLIPGGSGLSGARNVQVEVGGHFRVLADRRAIAAVLAAADPA